MLWPGMHFSLRSQCMRRSAGAYIANETQQTKHTRPADAEARKCVTQQI